MLELESDFGIPKTCVLRIPTENLGTTRVCAKFIPKLLTVEQKRFLFQVAEDSLEMVANDENGLKKIITGDESWVYGYDPEKKTSLHSGSFHPSHDRKKHVKVGAMSRPCRLFSLIMKVLYIMNMLQEVKRTTKNFSLNVWRDRVTEWQENGGISGWVATGSFTCASAFIEPCATVFRKTQDSTTSPASVQSRRSLLRLLAVPKMENSAQRARVRRHRDDWKECDEYTEDHFENGLPELLQDVEAPMGACCSVEWGLFRSIRGAGRRRIIPARG